MIRIKRFIHFSIVCIAVMLAVFFSGCGEKAVPVSGAANDLQARFEKAFDNFENDMIADGTVRFEPASETSTNIITTAAIPETTQEVQEETFVITPSGTRYHLKTCHTAHNIKEYLTREEAELRGYGPCKICKP